MLPQKDIGTNLTHRLLQHSASLEEGGEEGGAWQPSGSHGRNCFLRLKLKGSDACGMNPDRFPLPQEQQSLVYGELQLSA